MAGRSDDVSAAFPVRFPRLRYKAKGPPARLQHKLPEDPIRDATHGLCGAAAARARPAECLFVPVTGFRITTPRCRFYVLWHDVGGGFWQKWLAQWLALTQPYQGMTTMIC